MPFKEHIYSVLIVSASDKFSVSLRALLPEKDYSPVNTVTSINAAQRELLDRSYDLVMINTPLPDDFGRKLAIDISENKNAVAILFVRNEFYEETYAKVVDYGVFTIHKPTSAQMITQSLDWLRATRERLRKLEKKNISLEDKMAEIRLVNRAKWVLIEQLKMTESDAHRYIEKQAMDRCATRREIAENILQTYK